MYGVCVCVSVHVSTGALGDQTSGIGPHGDGVQVVVSCLAVDAGTNLG